MRGEHTQVIQLNILRVYVRRCVGAYVEHQTTTLGNIRVSHL